MAETAKSLVCGVCGEGFTSVAAAQAHAEDTGHADFAESAAGLVRDVCEACGKPCRSAEERQLHTVRTGHTHFTTAELALVGPGVTAAAAGAGAGADASTPAPTAEGGARATVPPTVPADALEALRGMGFGEHRAVRALHANGGNVEAAVEWLAGRADEAGLDEPLLVAAAAPALTPEEVKERARALQERARALRAEKEAKAEAERLESQKHVAKELAEARRLREEQEKKLECLRIQKEKEAEKKYKQKILNELEKDRRERASRAGGTSVEASAPDPVEGERKAKVFDFKSALRFLRMGVGGSEFSAALELVNVFLANLVDKPADEDKFRRVRKDTPAFTKRLGCHKGGPQVMQSLGFVDEDTHWVMPLPLDRTLLAAFKDEVSKIIVNPFYL